MTITYFEPFGRAWSRMKVALFKPFDLQKWLYFGFSAFLAGLADWHNGSFTSRWSDHGGFRDFVGFPHRAWDWLTSHPLWFALICFGLFVLIVVGILILWLSSRASFVFLDNVVRDKAEVANPWRRFRALGNSLFVWRLVFALAGMLLMTLLSVFFFITAAHFYGDRIDVQIPVVLAIGTGLAFFLLILIIAYIALFLRDFVVPIMYKNGMTAVPAWRRFLALFGEHPLPFILYGLIVLVLLIGFVIVVVFAGLLTCCIGWLLLAIPYIGTVITLPVWYIFRAYSLEFLAQFGQEYEVFARPEAPVSAPQA